MELGEALGEAELDDGEAVEDEDDGEAEKEEEEAELELGLAEDELAEAPLELADEEVPLPLTTAVEQAESPNSVAGAARVRICRRVIGEVAIAFLRFGAMIFGSMSIVLNLRIFWVYREWLWWFALPLFSLLTLRCARA